MTTTPGLAPPATAALLQLADGRLPSGGHAHSGGMEEAVADGRVHDLWTLEGYLRGRLWTVGRSDAALAASACLEAHRPRPRWADLDAEAGARCPSPALRRTARVLGRGLVRVAAVAWPGPWVAVLREAVPAGPFASVALGAAAAAAGTGPSGASLASAHGAVAGPAGAAVRLLALDPLEASALLARMAAEIDAVAVGAAAAAVAAGQEWRRLPASSAPLLDIGAEHHAGWEVRLFAS